MPTLSTVIAELKKKGTEKTRATFVRHGMPAERVLGVSIADLKVVAKTIRGQQELALELYATGLADAMYLAGLVADGKKMSQTELDSWAEGAVGLPMISEYPVPWVAVENAAGRAAAKRWMKGATAPSGWTTYSGLLATHEDSELDLKEIEGLLEKIPKGLAKAQNRERYTMNGFVIAVGSYVQPLSDKALATAQQMGKVLVEMGDTACEVPDAAAMIRKVEAAGKLGRKKKTIRC